LIRCRACGAENSDEARYCTRCGAPLRSGSVLYLGHHPRYRREGRIWLLLFGSVMVVYGLLKLLETYCRIVVDLWPVLVILFGAALLYGSLRSGGSGRT